MLNLEHLRRYAVARTLFTPTSLSDAIHTMGFVQADPIRSPARAQDLIMRHRVSDYRAGDLESQYPELAIEEDFFVNYGFQPRALSDLMHPRTPKRKLSTLEQKSAGPILSFVRERGVVHPKEVDAHFQHGSSRNWFGGTSKASTQLLDALHYRGLLRTAKRISGIRCYSVREIPKNALSESETIDRLIDVFVGLYAPLPSKTLGYLSSLLTRGVPQFQSQRAAGLTRAKKRLASAFVEGVQWFWPTHENPLDSATQSAPDLQSARLLAPFDPIVWDRARFAIFWQWPYRFEAYTPAAKRTLGYYAMPLLLGDQVIGWANVDASGAQIELEIGLKQRVGKLKLKAALADDLSALSRFLGKPLGRLQYL